jgi:hypothetical protein
MQMTDETAERALLAIKRFRIGGVLIAAFPLIPAFIHLVLRGGGGDSASFTIMSACLLLLVIWACLCAERFLKALRAAP